LVFSVLNSVRPLIEAMPLEKALEAYRRMKSSKLGPPASRHGTE
jgi:D-arabinose 1-dehydrogenase-like Zn-dependent alcohol dehydrogenase